MHLHFNMAEKTTDTPSAFNSWQLPFYSIKTKHPLAQ
jgi:hypothetical protein